MRALRAAAPGGHPITRNPRYGDPAGNNGTSTAGRARHGEVWHELQLQQQQPELFLINSQVKHKSYLDVQTVDTGNAPHER